MAGLGAGILISSLARIGKVELGMSVKEVVWNIGQMGGCFPQIVFHRER